MVYPAGFKLVQPPHAPPMHDVQPAPSPPGKSGYFNVGGLNVVIDPVGEFAVAASQPSSIPPFAQLGQFAAQSSSDILINLAQLAAGALEAQEDSQCPTDDEINSTVSCVAVASTATYDSQDL